MNAAEYVVSALLEAEEDFDARSYLLDPNSKTIDLLNEIRQGLASYYQSVEIFPATEGFASFPKFFKGGNRYRIRCKRSGPALRVAEPSGWDGNSAADNQRIMIEEFITGVVKKADYYLHHLKFSGNVYSNLLIMLDMWPEGARFKPEGFPD